MNICIIFLIKTLIEVHAKATGYTVVFPNRSQSLLMTYSTIIGLASCLSFTRLHFPNFFAVLKSCYKRPEAHSKNSKLKVEQEKLGTCLVNSLFYSSAKSF